MSNLPAWFTAMDTSRDGVISAREFLGTAEQFAALDKNQNGFFEPNEIPPTETPASNTSSEAAPAEPGTPGKEPAAEKNP
jgi:hypothetical protein